ncbi:MAG: CTP-dependent riboflavin kinase [Candidatus Diapherotrites archaeon]|nr:CTP-dependent riboflavin kinase [Candidatus Diapherotrites archaeon]
MQGTVVEGLQRARKFLSDPYYSEPIAVLLGSIPFPGTLNLELTERNLSELFARKKTAKKSLISARHNRGAVELIPALLNDSVPVVLVFPEKSTHAPSIVEVASGQNLRKMLGLKNGSVVSFNI